MKKSVKLTALFCAAALLASSMLSPMSVAVQAKAKKPTLSKKKITITLGKTAKLKVKRATGCKITWKSKKKKVVTVKKSGKYAAKLTAKKIGSAKVVATVKKGKKQSKLTCTVKVIASKKVVSDPSNTNSNTPDVSTTTTPIGVTGGTATPTGELGGTVTATPTPAVTSTATVSVTATASPTQTSTVVPTATPTPTASVNGNAIVGSTVKGTGAAVAAKVDDTGAVVEFKESPQYRQADFLMASSVSLENTDSVEFTLSVEGEPDSVSFKLYDSDGKELSNITQYNKKTGTYSIKVPDEYKDKIVTQYSIMTNSDIKDSTQTATATLTKLTFVNAAGKPTVTPTPVPAVTPAPEQESLTLSAKTLLLTSSVNDSPVYNKDGSVTLTIRNEYGGGGVAFYINNLKTSVDLSNYRKVIYTMSSEKEESFQINAYRSTNFWEGTEGKTPITLNTVRTTAQKKEFSSEFVGLDSVLGFGVRFCGWATNAEKVTLTIHSITLVKDERDIDGSITNYTSLAELAASYGLKMGTVMNDQNVKDKKYTDLMKYHFNSITAANEMKAYTILNESASKEAVAGNPDAMPALRFDGADAIMDFAKKNGIKVRGHVLVWDSDMCDWFFREGYDTSKKYASTEVVKARLKYYIEQVLIHFEQKYPGVIYCWDVVNEAVGDSSSEYVAGDSRHVRTKRGGKTNLFYDTIGKDYVELSFLYTYEAIQKLKGTYPALEDLKLYYNDYSTFQTVKRDAICELVKSINSYKKDESGKYIKLCDGVGMQSYIGGWGDDPQPGCMNEGDIALIKTAILKYASLGVEVQATELAVRNFLSDEATAKKHGEFYKKLFQMYLDVNSGTEKPLKAVSIWGIVDNPDLKKGDYSYSMNGPYCGLFDDKLAVKPAFVNIHNLMKNGQ